MATTIVTIFLYTILGTLQISSINGNIECGPVSHLDEYSGLLKSHKGFGSSLYPSNFKCEWYISPPATYGIRIHELIFDIEDSNNCQKDVVKLYSDPLTISFLCGKNTVNTRDLKSTSGFDIIFTSDDTTERLGFLLKYTFYPIPVTVQQCGDMTIPDGQTFGTIKSPHYPQNYNNSLSCRWKIVAQPGETITFKLNMKTAGLPRPECGYDYLYIENMLTGEPIGRYCGVVTNQLIKTNTSQVLIAFITDYKDTDSGFSLHWYKESYISVSKLTDRVTRPLVVDSSTGSLSPDPSQIPQKQLSSTQIPNFIFPLLSTASQSSQTSTVSPLSICGPTHYLNASWASYITTPKQANGEYFPNSDCHWLIEGEQGSNVVVNFETFALEASTRCEKDYLAFYDGPDESARLLSKNCGKLLPASVVASSNKILIKFHSDDNIEDKGFLLQYVQFLPVTEPTKRIYHCPVDITNIQSESGFLTSIGFNGYNSYSPNLNCQWHIITSPGKVLKLRFEEFEMEYEATCANDYLEIWDGTHGNSSLIGRHCGIRLPKDIITSSNIVYLKFISDDLGGGLGFNLTYTTIEPLVKCTDNEYRCLDGACINKTDVCNNVNDCMDGTDELFCHINETCGRPVIKPSLVGHRIIGGVEAVRGSWPWQAMLFHKSVFMCGGSLINPYWIVTAAHCFGTSEIPREWSLSLGQYYLHQSDKHTQKPGVGDIIIHPQYEYRTAFNDIALIRLSEPVNLTDYVNTVCLPTAPEYIGQRCYITGWGNSDSSFGPEVLKQAMVPVLNMSLCNDTQHYRGKLMDTMSCAGYTNLHIDACHGDSGGPLVSQYSDGRWYLQGITSFGIGCGDFKYPGVYTNIYKFTSWINQIVYQT